MGLRADKGRAIVRYLLGHTGIPALRWTPNGVESPPPYNITILTAARMEDWRIAMNARPKSGINIVVRYDGYVDGLENAWVGMRLSEFVPLLKLHYDDNQDRVATHLRGD